ncbi:hypothetical protein KIW84_021554 [Lathyrus oleraceus]|uniref:DUF7745 domain-containing protein n=1 Tax=Pisum sativum TaxID=3888 RepID=A0A9D4YDW5_PEA|nr:hypothetical protein KIW84_021554 [Pisum sativum]
MEVRNVIMSCGEFRNVPLVGTKGCINYNPVLSLRQLGFVMKGKPLEAEDGAVLGKKFAIAMPDYTDWVKKRVETLLLPYDRMEPLQEQPPLILAESVPAEHYKQALMENRRLREKEQDTQMELYKAKADGLNLAHQLRGVEGEDANRLRSKKRSYEEMESMLDAEHRECLRLQRAEASYQKKIRDLEKQLRDKDVQLKKEVDLRQASENYLGGEVMELRRQLKEKITPLPECSECTLLIDQCQYLKTLIPEDHKVVGVSFCSRLLCTCCSLVAAGVLVRDFSLWFLCLGRIADQRPHRYSTRLNHQRNMDQVQAELAEMRANMAHFMHMMQGVAQGQEELRALVQRQEAVIPPANQALQEGGPINDNATAVVPVNNYAIGDKLRGIRINGQPIAPETANARVVRAPARNQAPIVDRQKDMFTLLSEDEDILGRVDERDRKVEALAEKIRAMECTIF